jgi:hypothetical protein
MRAENCLGTYVPDASDTSGYSSDKIGIAWITFDSTSGASGTATPRIFVGVANTGANSIFVSNDAGATCKRISLYYFEHALNPSQRVCGCWSKHHIYAPSRCPLSFGEDPVRHLQQRRRTIRWNSWFRLQVLYFQ